jgi:hypothetical protein
MTSTIDYSNSSLPICINLQLGQGCGLDPSRNNSFVDISEVILSKQNDVLITTKPTDITQLTFLDTHDRPFPIPLPDGSTVTVWQCGSNAASEICAAKYDKNNNRVIAQRVINTDTTGAQGVPKGVLLPDGRLLISWRGAVKAKAKVFLSDLSTSIDEFNITSALVVGTQIGVTQVVLNDGRTVFLVDSLVSSGRIIINGTILDVDTKTGSDFQLSASIVGYQQGPDMAVLPDGGLVVVWHGNIQGNSFINIFIRRFYPNITPVGVETTLTADENGVQISPFAGDQTFPKVAVNNEKICVIWECSLQGRTFPDICLNTYNLDFIFIKAFTPLNNYNPNNNRDPYIVSLSSGGFRAAWRSQAQGSTFNSILTVLLDGNVSKAGGESRINTNSDALSNTVRVAASSLNGRATIAWSGSNDIYYRVYNSRVMVDARGGDDHIVASGMGDTLDCGSGFDNISYAEVLSPCTIDLTTGKGCGEDRITGCENIITPPFGVTITCNGNNIIYGGAGDEVIRIMGLPVTIYGGEGNNLADFRQYNRPIKLDLNKGTGTDGNSNITLYNISTIRGSNYGDNIVTKYNNTIYCGDGDDTIVVAEFPATIDGEKGMDTLSFELFTSPVTFDMTANTGTDGIEIITATRVENVIGSQGGGSYTGNTLKNTFRLKGGINDINGMGGSDTVSYQDYTVPVEVNLQIGRGARGDTYSNIANVICPVKYPCTVRGANDKDDALLKGGDYVEGDAKWDYADVLTPGDALNTVLIGGLGGDRFGLGLLVGSTTIMGFEINNKKEVIDLTGSNIYSMEGFKEMIQDGNNTIITLRDNAQVTLNNVRMIELTPEDFIFDPVPANAHSGTSTVTIIAYISGPLTIFAALVGLGVAYSRWRTSIDQKKAAEAQLYAAKAQEEYYGNNVEMHHMAGSIKNGDTSSYDE